MPPKPRPVGAQCHDTTRLRFGRIFFSYFLPIQPPSHLITNYDFYSLFDYSLSLTHTRIPLLVYCLSLTHTRITLLVYCTSLTHTRSLLLGFVYIRTGCLYPKVPVCTSLQPVNPSPSETLHSSSS